ncbi:MAG: ShlB/FhaC/HecB family hemolysin secretion/activation protein [Gemmatimonadales bacterium]
MGANFLILLLSAAPLQASPPDTTSPDSSPAAPPIERVAADSFSDSPAHGIAYERLTDIVRYDRVQGLSFGVGYRVRVPGIAYARLYGTVRYGLSDQRVAGRLTVLRDAPGGRFMLSGYREISALDPFAPGHGFGNSLDALFAAHDNGDYLLVHGVSLAYEVPLRMALALGLGVNVQREESVDREARSAINDFFGGSGLFPPNPQVAEGTYGSFWARLDGYGKRRWRVTADLQAGDGRSTGRVYGAIRQDFGGRRGATLDVKAGVATNPTLPQALFRLGGVSTVRGFEYGALSGQAFWAARLDIAPIRGRLRPVLFADAGQAARVDDLFSSKALIGAGVGLSVFDGILRLDLSHPISPDIGGNMRFDIVVQAAR